MYKIIDLGSEFSSTHEPRARILDRSLVKTASSEIQEYWDTLERNDKYAYLWVIGVSAMEYYGCNNNGDAFSEDDLKKTIPDWEKNAHIFIHHVNKDPRKSIGKPVYAWYNDEMHRVELVLAIDRNANGASAIVERIRNGEQMYVSMGCHVAYDVCSICGHQSKTRAEYCDHLRFNMKRILPDGKQVYAFNPNPKFFDISIVTRPADPTAFALDKIASEGQKKDVPLVKSSAELGEESEDLLRKAASVYKLADIIKQVDGRIVDSLIEPDIKPVRDIAECGFDDFDYPEMPYEDLDRIGATPMCLMRGLASCGAQMSLSDAYWMSGLKRHGMGMREALSLLPEVLESLGSRPQSLDGCLGPVLSRSCDNEPLKQVLTIKIIQPVAVKRIMLVRRFPMDKTASNEANFRSVIVRDKNGNLMRTNRYFLNQAKVGNMPAKVLGSLFAMAALGSLLFAPDVVSKVVASGMASVPAYALLSNDNHGAGEHTVETSDGHEYSATLVNQAWKQPVVSKTAALNFGTQAGMIAPAAVALDYAYNKWKANKTMTPEPDNKLHRLGRLVKDHPAVAAFVGGTAGAAGQRLLQKIFRVK